MAKQFRSQDESKNKGFRSGKGKANRKNDTRSRGKKILKDSRTDGMDERYSNETAGPSMKNPNAGRNDASWYTYSPAVVAIAGTVNFNSPIGVPFSNTPTVLDDDNTQVAYATDPSVMRIAYVPTPGKVGTGGYPNLSTNAPVNLQIRSMYTLMQATVTQNLPFAAADLGVHIFYMDNVYMMWGHLQRLYYIWRKYDIMNRTVPKTLLNAYGLSGDVLHNPNYTLNDFQAELLLMEQEIRRIAIPAGFDVLNRHYWMTKHVFMDEDSLKPQLYMFTPNYLWGFDDQGSTGGELVLNRIPVDSSEDGVRYLMTWFRTYLDDFYNDKDVWTLNGYILRAFNNFWMPDSLDISGIIQPVYQPEVLMQIHNATPVGTLFGARTSSPTNYHQQVEAEDAQHGRITQDNKDNMVWLPTMVYDSILGVGGAIMDSRAMLDLPMPVPTPSDVLVATRLITKAANTVFTISGTECVALNEYGTEIVTRVRIYDGVNDASDLTVDLSQYGHWGLNIYDEGTSGLNIRQIELLRIAEISKFAHAPILPLTIDHGGTNYGWYDFVGGMNNYTVVDSNVIRKLHDAAAMGEWLIK